jgi:integrase
MLESLSFGEPYQLNSGSKVGRWTAKATYPAEHRGKFKSGQSQIYLGSGTKADAISRLPKKAAEAQRKYRDAIAAHDPLLEAAERLYDALFATYEAGGKRLPLAEWWPSPITKEELLKLRHYTSAASTEKTEFNRIVQSLRDEVYKLLHAEYDSSTHGTVPDALSYLRDEMLKTDASNATKERLAETIEMLQSNMDLGIEVGAPRYQYWQPQGYLAGMEKDLREQGKTDVEIKEHIKLLYNTGMPRFTFEALNKRDIINDALKAFEDQHSQRSGTKLVVGKTYSDAMQEWSKSALSGAGNRVKRLKTHGEYTNSQNLFLELFGNLDLSEISRANALGMMEHLEKTGAANGTITKHLSGIKAPIKRAIELAWITDDPMKGVETSGRGKPLVKTQNWNTEDFKRLFAQDIPKQELMLFQLLSVTGFRLEEGAAIEWQDIKTNDNGVNYFDLHGLNKILKTEQAMRNVPIHQKLLPLLNAYGEAVGRTGRLFEYPKDIDGKCNRTAVKALSPYLKVARHENGKEVKHIKTHGLRGTFTSACYKVGMPDSMRRFIGGWKQQGEDQAYLEPDLDKENEMLQKIDFVHIGNDRNEPITDKKVWGSLF